jgi:hypothetical protein
MIHLEFRKMDFTRNETCNKDWTDSKIEGWLLQSMKPIKVLVAVPFEIDNCSW